jgi:hypothetical protein
MVCKNCGKNYHNCMSCGNEYYMLDFCCVECLEAAGFTVCPKCRGWGVDCWDDALDDAKSGCRGYIKKTQD